MAGNHLEQLVAEWYEYQGYFVRQNVQVGRLPRGGYEGELDVVAFHPQKRYLVHIEPSLDAHSWAVREARFQKKFQAGQKYIPALFSGLELPTEIEQIALLVYASTRTYQMIGGGRIVLAQELLAEIFSELSALGLATSAIPEHLPILRSFQFVATYQADVWKALNSVR